MDVWDWFQQCEQQWLQKGDQDRLRMMRCFEEGFDLQEVDPERTLALFQEGKNLAVQLDEPWWALFFDVERLGATIEFLGDFREVLDLAIQCNLQFQKPQFANHPFKFTAQIYLAYAYMGIDPLGFADAVQQALVHLEKNIPQGTNEEWYLLLRHQQGFARAKGDFQKAVDIILGHLNLLDGDPYHGPWYATAIYADLCWLSYRMGDWQAVAEYAGRTEELSRQLDLCQLFLAEALTWKAALARRSGDEGAAARFYRNAVTRLTHLKIEPNSTYYDAMSFYHEIGNDFGKALDTRRRQWQGACGKGMLAYEFIVHLRKCQVLGQMGSLQDSDYQFALSLAGKLRKPDVYLAELEKLKPKIRHQPKGPPNLGP